MQLPGAAQAIIDPAKLRDYLLSFEHPVERSKARFFSALGFARLALAWPELNSALRRLALTSDAEPGVPSPFGQKYVVRGNIQGSAGRSATIVTVWIVLAGEQAPRFITAQPADAR